MDTKKITQEILDVLIKNNLRANQASEIINAVSQEIWEVAVLPTSLPKSERLLSESNQIVDCFRNRQKQT